LHLDDIGRARGRASEHQVTWGVKPGATLADLATIDLRRITDVLQVDHASLFLRDPDDPQRAAVVAETGLPVSEALPEHSKLLSRVLHSGRGAEIQHPAGPGEPCSAALATPLVHEDRAVGAVLVVTRRANRKLGAIDAQVVQRATKKLVERFLAPSDRHEQRFARDAPASRR
jgi:GAF domain-containing protein